MKHWPKTQKLRAVLKKEENWYSNGYISVQTHEGGLWIVNDCSITTWKGSMSCQLRQTVYWSYVPFYISYLHEVLLDLERQYIPSWQFSSCTMSEQLTLFVNWLILFTSRFPGIDDAESECGLDQGVDFDQTVRNDGDVTLLDAQLEGLLSLAKERTREQHCTLHSVKSNGQWTGDLPVKQKYFKSCYCRKCLLKWREHFFYNSSRVYLCDLLCHIFLSETFCGTPTQALIIHTTSIPMSIVLRNFIDVCFLYIFKVQLISN